ncbi:MAG: BAX inhibitor (BI)-1/YccA family protein, partial [Betaproteobacteria bacterium]|nr:BAX inhibitor (BI)-1/YccA family protein [Betaproteobacteria bacterium]
TILGAFVGTQMSFAFMAESPLMSTLLMIALMFGLMFGVSALRNSIAGVFLLLGFTFVMGVFLGPILQYSAGFANGGQLVGIAAGGTALVFFVLATIATVSKRDFSNMGKFLLIGLVMLIVASLANIFLHLPALALTISALSVLIFSAFILYDVSRVVQGGETNYVMATLSIYLDIYNLFVNLLQLLLALAGNRD